VPTEILAAQVIRASMKKTAIQAERDVVQEEPLTGAADVDPSFLPVDERIERADRIAAVEADVPREVVPRAERDADEGEVTLDRNLRDRCHGSVPARHAKRVGLSAAGELGRVVRLGVEHMRFYPAAAGLLHQVLPARGVVTRAPGGPE